MTQVRAMISNQFMHRQCFILFIHPFTSNVILFLMGEFKLLAYISLYFGIFRAALNLMYVSIPLHITYVCVAEIGVAIWVRGCITLTGMVGRC